LNQRNGLINAAEKLMGEGKLEEAQAKMKEVEDLDAKWEDIKVANANLKALKDKEKLTNIETQTEKVDGKVIGNLEVNEVKNEEEIYVDAWAKHLMGVNMTRDEQIIFAKKNN